MVPGLAQALCVDEQVCIVGNPWPVAAQPASAGAGVVIEMHEAPDVPVLNAHREGQQLVPSEVPPTHAASPVRHAAKSAATISVDAEPQATRRRASESRRVSDMTGWTGNSQHV